MLSSMSINHSRTAEAPWTIRAAQLDLARQKETLPAIGQFISFVSRWGYNTLVLYLEGVVRTRSFPYRAAKDSYTPDEIRQIVAMAGEAGLQVVPCISTLGHTEHFLEHPQLRHLAEGPGRSFPNSPLFCPSNPAVYRFLEDYLGEVAALFPAAHFHIGGDETWRLGSDAACRARLQQGQTIADLMLGHVEQLHGILQRLNRRTWMWEDMFDYLSEQQIGRFPRDLVLCAWCYQVESIDLSGVQGHFNNRQRRDSLGIYDRLGFDVIVCPVRGAGTPAWMRYAQRHRVLGGLQTLWSLNGSFLPAHLPMLAVAGRLWSDPLADEHQTEQETLRQLLPSTDEAQRAAVRLLIEGPMWRIHDAQTCLQGPLVKEEERALRSMDICRHVLSGAAAGAVDPLERDILLNLDWEVREQQLYGHLRELLPRLVDPRRDAASDRVLACRAQAVTQELRAVAAARAEQWEYYRNGLEPDHASGAIRRLEAALQPHLSLASQQPGPEQGLVDLSLFLWECHSAPRLRVLMRAETDWQEVWSGTAKPVNLRRSYYRWQIPMSWPGPRPTVLRLVVSGYGGQGVSFARVVFRDSTLVPVAVAQTSGKVEDPQAVLRDNSSVCYLGDPDTVATLLEFREDEQSVLDLELAPATA